MKIEKINDRQIRCTLTREDLASREINLNELAYGSEKARELFQDMMQLAAQDLGFEADNIPLVVEAIPLSMEAILIIITKVEDPEELDTRFARFSPEGSGHDAGLSYSDLKDKIEGADDILGLIKKITEARKRAAQKTADSSAAQTGNTAETSDDNDEELGNLTRSYLFFSLDDAIRAAKVLGSVYDGPNSLYKEPESGQYYLLLRKADCVAEQFNKTCNILSEYALACKFIPGMDSYFTEHFNVILSEKALQNLALL